MAHNKIMCIGVMAMAIAAGTIVKAQTADASFNAAIHDYIKAVMEGNVSRQVGLYEKGGLKAITHEQLEAAMSKELAARGKPVSCEVVCALTKTKTGYATFDVRWKQGITEKFYTFWVRNHGKWRLTEDPVRAQCPDMEIWREFDATILTAAKCTPESWGDNGIVVWLTSDVLNAIREGHCGAVKEKMSSVYEIGYTLGWDVEGEMEYRCRTFFTDMVRLSGLLDQPFVPTNYKCSAAWKTGQNLFREIPGHPMPQRGCKFACWEVTISEAAGKAPRDFLVVTWIYTPQGLRLWDIKVTGVSE